MTFPSTPTATDVTPGAAPAGRATRRPSRALVRGVGLGLAATLATAGCAAGQVAQTAYQKSTIDGVNASIGSVALRGLAVAPPSAQQKSYAKGGAAALVVVLVNERNEPDTLTSISGSAIGGWSYFAAAADAQGALSPSATAPSASATPGAGATGASGSQTSSPSISAGSSASVSEPGTGTVLPGSESASGSSTGSSTGATTSSSAAPTSAAPTGTRSVPLPGSERVSFGTPDAKGALLITGLTQTLYPGTTLRLRFTFQHAGSKIVDVPVQLAELPRTAEVPGAGQTGGE